MSDNTTSTDYKRRFWSGLAFAALLLIGVGLWTNHAARESIHDLLEQGLTTVLDGNIKALEVWFDNQETLVDSWSEQPGLVQLATQLKQLDQQDSSTLRAHPAQKQLLDLFNGMIGEDDLLGFALINHQGLILSADQPEYIGRQIATESHPWLQRIQNKEILLIKPFPKNRLVEGLDKDKDRPIMVAAAPVETDNGEFLAALVFSIDPEGGFTRILNVGRMGRSGNTYAFDKRGYLLSESRFDPELKKLGMIPDLPEASSLLRVQLRDPGGDMTRGFKPPLPRDQQPLTEMAEAAINGGSGIDLDGYRDFRGVTVFGTWRWLDDYNFGVATEASRDEALRALRPAKLAFIGLLVFLALVAGGLLFTGRLAIRLYSKVEEIRQLGQYTLLEKIGEGGMGSVYRASHALLRRPTAVKLIRDDASNHEALIRFEQEVQATSQLTHPNTIAIYDYGRTPDGVFYYAMEYLSGLTLGQLVRIENQVFPARVIHILRQVCGSLAEAHQRGLIHRDIKPGNVILCQRGGDVDVAKVLDFGLVQEIAATATAAGPSQMIPGTPDYIAPERLVIDRSVDARSDLYAVGAIGFLLLTGQVVFPPDKEHDICYRVVHSPPRKPSETGAQNIPEGLDLLILSCLAKDPDQRPESASAMLQILDQLAENDPWEQSAARRWWQEKQNEIRLQRKLDQPEAIDGDEMTVATNLPIDLGGRGNQLP